MMQQEAITDFYNAQLQGWQLAKDNYEALRLVRRRHVRLGQLPVIVQYNPGRAKSTNADVSKEGISSRPCFLCAKNRPKEQLAGTAIADYEILINPYPILPVHFTVCHKQHAAQSAMPLEMVDFVNMLPESATFFNGAKAGASAPDHLHFQAVLKSEIPLLKIVEQAHTREMPAGMASTGLGDFPMSFISFIIPPTFDGMRMLSELPCLGGVSAIPDEASGLVNDIMWKDDSGLLRLIVFPRKAHRPRCFYATDHSRRLVSPGALDMAGIIIIPDESDFDRITGDEITGIYAETGLTASELAGYCRDSRVESLMR